VREARESKAVAPDTTAIIVLDSIRKLIPKDQFKMIMVDAKKIAKGGLEPEAARSRITQIKAQMSAAWTDELVPLLEKSGVALVVIAREIEDPDNTNERARRAKTNVKTTGGKAWFYDASLDLRSSKAGSYGETKGGEDGEEERKEIWGRRYCVEITKTKVSGEGEEYRAKFFFHVSNGKKTPKGFDRAKDLLELAKRKGVIATAGGWFKFGVKRWQGEAKALAALQDPALLAAVEERTRATFKLEETR
jgi:RecA/RadA recombinase